MLKPGRIYPGTTVTLTAAFTDSSGVASDPTTVIFKTYSPHRVSTTYTYGVDSEVAKSSVGNYTATFVPDIAGRWYIRWETTGSTMTTEDNFVVTDSPFVDSLSTLDYD